MSAEGKRACVIGAGFGGLALALRLQAAGVATTVVEAREEPGGHAGCRRQDGFAFDTGPAAIADPAMLSALWDLTGHSMADDVELLPVAPLRRFIWPDGTSFDQHGDEAALRREIARLDPADIAGYDAFLAHAAIVHREGYQRFGASPFLDLRSAARAAPAFVRHRGWRSLHDTVAGFVNDERLREALSYPALATGANPMTASGFYAYARMLEQSGGLWWARGGTSRLAAAMARQFQRIGGELRTGDPVTRIETIGTRASEVETLSGWRAPFDAVASNADAVHTYRDLIGDTLRGQREARRLARKRFAPSLFSVHFGIEGSWPGIPHQTVLFGPRFAGLLDDIFDHGVLPADASIFLDHPSVTDPSMAPEGMSAFRAWIPVAHLGKLAIDWDQIGPVVAKRLLDEVERRLIPDIHDRIVTRFHYTPRDVALDFNAHLGSAFGLESIPAQSGLLRPHNRDKVIGNLYLVGANTHPGAGVPGVLAGAGVTAGLMLAELAG